MRRTPPPSRRSTAPTPSGSLAPVTNGPTDPSASSPGPTIDGVTHNITVNIDNVVEADSVYDFVAQELALGSIFRP